MESIDNNFLFAVMWYVMGIFSYKIISKVLDYGNIAYVYKHVLLSMLSLLKTTSNNFEHGNDFLREASLRAGIEEENIKLEVANNEKVLEVWREMIVVSIINTTPVNFRRLIPFKNWDGAMKHLRKSED
jgi:hypothetical protein